jgi:putative transcriptional regulator
MTEFSQRSIHPSQPSGEAANEVRLTVHLKAIRRAAGLTQVELARKIGVSRKTVNTVENAVFVPSTKVALRLARALDSRVEDLFSLDE